MAECCCCPESRHSDSRSHMINCFLVGTGTSWLCLGQGLPPSLSRRVCVCMCVNVCEQERQWWKAKTVTQRGKECYVLFYEFVCHCTLSLNMCYCFERRPHSEVVRSLVECGENDRCESRGWICPATFLCSLELDCAMLKVFNGLFPAIVSLPHVVMMQILWRVINHALITWSKWKML